MSDHFGRVMNLQVEPFIESLPYVEKISYKNGHKVARHAAAEVVLELEQEIEELKEAIKQLGGIEILSWTDVNDKLPPTAGYYLVACAGGNVEKTFYHPDIKIVEVCYPDSHYSRRHLGKNSGYFDLSHKFGYKVMFWQEIPAPPEQVFIDGDEL